MDIRKYLVLLCMICASHSSFIKAYNLPQCITPGSTPFVEQRWSTTVGPLFNFARYRFNNNDVDCCGSTTSCCDFPHAQGYLAGLHFDITHSRPSHWFFTAQFDGEWNAGYINNTAGTFLQVSDYRPETDVGYTFYINKNHYFITPFAGLGFYFLSTEFKRESQTNKYNNLYIPIGLNVTWNVHPDCYENVVECFTAGITATYRIDAWTRLKITNEYDKCPSNRSCNAYPCDQPCIFTDYTLRDDRIKLDSRTQGVHVEAVFTWFPTFNQDKINFEAVGAPFFDWNRFGSACAPSCEGVDVPVAKLTRWYVGVHAQLGIRF